MTALRPRAVYEGVCDIGIANTYYMGKMQTNEKKPVQKKWAASVNIMFPNQADRARMSIYQEPPC